jgi:MoaA/NifB/PqqE/SkfB family radical SAM enzyme
VKRVEEFTAEAPAAPEELFVELTNVCNLRCVMCPRTSSSRDVGFMDPGLFRKIVDEAAHFPFCLLLPHGMGEALLHHRWENLVGYASDRGMSPIWILTNGTLLDEPKARFLVDRGIDLVLVSVDGITQDTYGKVRVGGDLRQVEANVEGLLRLRAKAGKEKPAVWLRMLEMEETREEIRPFEARWRSLLSRGDGIDICPEDAWCGKVRERMGAKPDGLAPVRPGPCTMPWEALFVYWDGRVSMCCLDSEAELLAGDVRRNSLLEIWRGDRYNEVRCLHREGRFREIPLCGACTHPMIQRWKKPGVSDPDTSLNRSEHRKDR